MRLCFFATLLLLLSAFPAYAQEPLPANDMLVVKDGDPVLLRISQALSSETTKAGQEVHFTVVKPIKSGDLVLVGKGAVATGKVVAVEKRRRKGRGGRLSIAIESVQLVTGETARLRAVADRANPTSTVMVTDMVGWTLYTGGLGAPLIPFFLLEHGDAMIIPEGSRFTAFLDGDVSLNREVVVRSQPAPEVPNPDVATVYLYRRAKHDYQAINPPITCGEALVGVFNPGEYQRLELPPGKYWFHAGPETGKVLAKAHKEDLFSHSFDGGHTYYIELSVHQRLGLRRDWEVIFLLVSPAEGEEALFEIDHHVDSDPQTYTALQKVALQSQPPPGRLIR